MKVGVRATPTSTEKHMIYFYWLTGLGLAILLSVVVSTTLDNREAADE